MRETVGQKLQMKGRRHKPNLAPLTHHNFLWGEGGHFLESGAQAYMIEISIVSYRDTELLHTVRSAWDNAKQKNNIYFIVVSQAEDDEHPDLSFIPKDHIVYKKYHWSKSKGVCWAREIASRNLKHIYFLQIDSHSRFRKNWDETIVNAYNTSCLHYGDIVFSCHPDGYIVTPEGDKFVDKTYIPKVVPTWSDSEKMVWPKFHYASNNPLGDEIYTLAAGSLFCFSEYLRLIPYDKNLYFTGEEVSLALRLYTRGIKIINTPVKFMYHEYKNSWGKDSKEWKPDRRPLHWEDNVEWYKINRASYERLAKILTGDKRLGVYGIDNEWLYNTWIAKTGIDLMSKKEEILSKGNKRNA